MHFAAAAALHTAASARAASAARAAVSARAASAVPLAELLEADDESPAGPGWYESSWDLRRGLEVCEAPWSEAVAAWSLAL
jgi:hypothetical protein